MTAFWFCYGLYIASNPEGTRICLIGTHEEGPTVVRFQQVFDYVHFREFTVLFAARMRLFCRFSNSSGFFICVAFILRAKEVAARVLIAEPERSVLCC